MENRKSEKSENEPDAIDAVRAVMIARGLSQRGLSKLIGIDASDVWKIMNRERQMSLKFARRGFTVLHLPAQVMLSPTRDPDGEFWPEKYYKPRNPKGKNGQRDRT